MLTLFLLPAGAQSTLGSIFGTVTDSSGAVIPNATVTVLSIDQGTKRTTATSGDGAYRVAQLMPGTYRVIVTRTGFAKTQSAQIPLAIEATVRADLALKPGSETTVVEVTAANPLLNTGSAEVSTQITQEELLNLPSLDRNIVGLMSLAPGVTGGNYDPSSPNAGGRVGQITGAEVVSMGTPPVGNSFLVDGVATNMEFSGTIAARPPMDMASGIQTQIAQFPADEGRASGAILNMSIKSGTNKFHGSIYGYVQNSAANAQPKNYLTNNAKVPYHRYQYGTNLGGPIIRDKLFFFAGYEGIKQLQTTLTNYTVPAMSEKYPVSQYASKGIVPKTPIPAGVCTGANDYYFGATTDANGAAFGGITVYDPTSLAYGSTTTRTPFPNNCIPGSYISPTSQALLKLYPDPNNLALGARSYAQPVPRQLTGDWETEKTNWTITPKDSIDLHFLRQNQFLASTGLNPDITSTTLAQNGINSGVNYFRVISPNMVNVARVAYTRFFLWQVTANQQNFLSGVIPGWPVAGAVGPPTIAPASISTLAPLQLVTAFASPFRYKENNYSAQDMLSWQKGNHSFKFGAEYEQIRFWQNRGRSGGGNLTFNGTSTSSSTSATLSDGIPDMLLGLSSAVVANYVFTPNGVGLRTHYIMPFVQDDWRALKNLTINMGLRYDIFTPYHVDKDQTENFDPTTGTVLIPSSSTFASANYGFTTGLPAHWQYVPRDQVYKKIYWKSFDPRIGFNLQINPRLLWRGGYGIYHIPVMGNTPLNGTTNTNDVTPSITTGAPFCVDNSHNGWCPTVGLPSDPTGGFKAALTSQGFVPFYYQRNLPDPYSEKYTTDIQFSPTHNSSVDIGYLGASTKFFAEIYNMNQAQVVSSSITLVNRQPYPNFGTSLYNYGQADHTNYNGGFVNFQFQKWHGLQFKSYYTYSKTLGIGTGNDQVLISPYIPDYDYGPLDYDIRHRWVTTFIYRIPKPSQHLVGAIVGNWDLSGIVNFQSGLPMTVSDSGGTVLNVGTTGGSGQRPYMLRNPNLPKGQRSTAKWFDTTAFAHTYWCTGANFNSDFFTTTALVLADSANPCQNKVSIPANAHVVSSTATSMAIPWGNEGKNIIGGPPQKLFTTAIQRRFVLEKGSIVIRLEEYNLFNHPNYQKPGNLNINAANLGVITSSQTGPRQLQGTLRFDF
ncbi:MAG: carboxypeptidase-like regulatory domain-containing protein [Acidobacteriota bacterium]